MQIEDILNRTKQVNKSIAQHNSDNNKQEGARDALKNRLVMQMDEFNKKYGTAISLDDTSKIEELYKNTVKEIYRQTKHVEEVLEAVKENDIKKVSELTGVDIGQDTIKMPNIQIDMDEMEKHAEKAYAETVNNLKLGQELIGEGLEVEEQEDDESAVEYIPEIEIDVEDEATEVVESKPNATDLRQQLMNASTPPTPVVEVEDEEPLSFGTPNFNKPKEESKVAPKKPNFSALFGKSFKDNDGEEKDDSSNQEQSKDIGSFVQGFGQQKTDSKPSDNKVADALSQQKVEKPKFSFADEDFGDIDVD